MKRSKLLLGTLMCTLFFGFIFLISCKDKDDPKPAGPSVPELTSPADEAVNQPLTPTLTWEEAEAESGVEEYALYFGTTADPSTLIFTGTNTSVTFSTPLENSTTYYWKVQVTDTKDRVATSEIFSFTTVGEEGFVIPDAEFGKALEGLGYATEEEGTYMLDMAAAATITGLDLGGSSSAPLDIQDIDGIQFFSALRYLDVDYTSISELDLSNNANLDTLQYTNSATNTANFLTSMDLPAGMLRIRVFRHNLSDFDATEFADLEYLRLDGDDIPNAAVGGVTNVLSTLTVDETSNPNLVHLDMGGNRDANGDPITYQVSQALYDQLTDDGANNKDGLVLPPTFSVETVDPADAATDVSTSGAITVTFSDDVDESSIAYTLKEGSNSASTTSSVNGAVLTITPSSNLINSTTYTLEITEADGLNGASLEAAFSSTFTTIAPGEISVTSVEISSNTLSTSAAIDQADRSGEIVVTFTSSVESTFASGSYTLLAGASSVPSTFTASGSVVTITPSSTLDALTDFTVTLLSANPVADNGGSLDADEAYDFKTAFFTGGDGSENYPYEINEALELDSVRRHLDAYFEMTGSVDLDSYLTGDGWDPIVDFAGSIEGNFNEVQNIWITSGSDRVGLFGVIDGGSVSNLGLTIHSNGILGGQYVGGMVGELANNGTISKCYVLGGTIATNVGGTASRTGGFVGYITSGSITESFTTANVGGTTLTGSSIADRVGGFVGGIGALFGGISDSYATGSVSGDADTGGFFGWASGSADKSLINGVYSSGDVTTTDPTTSGIFAGNDFDGTTLGSGYYNTDAILMGGNASIGITNLTGVDFSINGDQSSSFPDLSTSTWAFGPSGISGSNGPVLQWEVGD